jgi:hypothetical protein
VTTVSPVSHVAPVSVSSSLPSSSEQLSTAWVPSASVSPVVSIVFNSPAVTGLSSSTTPWSAWVRSVNLSLASFGPPARLLWFFQVQ